MRLSSVVPTRDRPAALGRCLAALALQDVGELDVVVTDGFTGNVCLKMAEGMLHMLFGEVRRVVDSSPRMKAGGALLMPGLREMGERLDYRRYGAVPVGYVDSKTLLVVIAAVPFLLLGRAINLIAGLFR